MTENREAIEEMITQAKGIRNIADKLPASGDRYDRDDMERLMYLKRLISDIQLRLELIEFNFFGRVHFNEAELF